MVVTLLGMVMLVSPVHPRNAPSPMVVTLLGMVMLVSPVHPENAELAILSPPVRVTICREDLLGMSESCSAENAMLTSAVHPVKALDAMESTLSGMVMWVMWV